jgi:ABC transporter ATM
MPVLTFHEVLNVQIPFIFKNVVDSLNVDIHSGSTVWVLAGSLILGCKSLTCFDLKIKLIPIVDGAARIGATVFGELLNAVFANVGQRAVRKVARETFEHLLNLDLRFHLSRQTGGLTRAIDRGTKFVSFNVFIAPFNKP